MKKLPLSLLTFAAASSTSALAYAQACTSDADCPTGSYCGCAATDAVPDRDDPGAPDVECSLTCQEYVIPEDECATDADCDFGFACESMGVATDCAEAPPCPDGETCPEPPPCPPAEEYSWSACVPAPVACATDADCGGSGLSCETWTYELCSGSTEPSPGPDDPSSGGGSSGGGSSGSSGADAGSEDGGRADDDEDFTCETVTESYCAPSWVGSCASDADCGAGFSCVEMESCACAGGGGEATPGDSGSDPSGGGGRDADIPDDCTCTGSGEFYCELQQIDCASDADCPAEFVCEVTAASTAPCTSDPESGEADCGDATTEETRSCVPEAYGAWGGAAADTGAPRGEAEHLSDPTAAPSAEDDSAGDGGVQEPLEQDGSRPTASSGCAAAPQTSSSAFALLGLLGLLGVRRRR